MLQLARLQKKCFKLNLIQSLNFIEKYEESMVFQHFVQFNSLELQVKVFSICFNQLKPKLQMSLFIWAFKNDSEDFSNYFDLSVYAKYYLYSIKYQHSPYFQLNSRPFSVEKSRKMINLSHLNNFVILFLILQSFCYFIFNQLLKSIPRQSHLLQIITEKLTAQIQFISYFVIN